MVPSPIDALNPFPANPPVGGMLPAGDGIVGPEALGQPAGGAVPEAAEGEAPALLAPLPEDERLLLDSFRSMLTGDRFRAFAVRHTQYSHRERFLHVISFGHKYSEARRAYHLEKRQAAEFSGAMIRLQTQLAALPDGAAGQVRIDAGGIALQIEQDAAGKLQAAIAPSAEIDGAERYELPLTARALSRKMLGDILRNPKDYGKHALLNELEVLRCPETHRGIFEAVLAEKFDIAPDDIAKIGARTLRDAAMEALRGGLHCRKHVLQRLDRALYNLDELQNALMLSDEQSRELTDRLEDAVLADAPRVAQSADIGALTAVPAAGRTPEQLRTEARDTRIHNFFADVAMNRDSTVHDRNAGRPGERLRETMLDHAETVVELLNGDDSLLDTLGADVADRMCPQMDRLRPFWELSRDTVGGSDRARVEGLLEALPADVLVLTENQIDAAVDGICALIAGQIRQLTDDVQAPPPLRSAHTILREEAGNIPQMAKDLCVRYRRELKEFTDNRSALNKKLSGELQGLNNPAAETLFLATSVFHGFISGAPEAMASDDTFREALETLTAPGGQPAPAQGIAHAWNLLCEALQDEDKRRIFGNTLERLNGVYEQQRPLEEVARTSVSTDKGYGQLVRRVMVHYFDALPEDSVENEQVNGQEVQHGAIDRRALDDRSVDRRSMVASLIRYTRNRPDREASAGEKLGALFKGAGPIMQKALQGMDAASLDPEFAKAIADMKSSLAPIDPKYVQAQLLDLVSRSDGAVRKITVDRSLGAASVGQAFLCTVEAADGSERSCVLKLLRPDVRNKATRERALFEHYAKQIPGMETTFAGQLERILSELDLRTEAANAAVGTIYNDIPVPNGDGPEEPPRVRSMEVMADVAPTENALLLERARGSDLARVMRDSTERFAEAQALANERMLTGTELRQLRFLADDLRDTHDRLCELSRKWVDEGIFGQGFYHGDLHAGNIMIDLPDRTQPVPEGEPAPQVGSMTVIDYGNATTLTKSQQRHVMVVMAGATFNRADWFKEGYLKLLPANEQENFKRLDTPNIRADGLLLDERGQCVHDRDGNSIRVSPDGTLLDAAGHPTRKKAPGRLTAMLEDIMQRGPMSEAAFRIAIPMTRLQEAGVACPAPIFNFSACQIRLQNAVDSLAARVDALYAFIGKEGDRRADDLMAEAMNHENNPVPMTDEAAADLACLNEALKNIPKAKRNVFFQEMGSVLGSRVMSFVNGIGLGKGLTIQRILDRR